MTLSSIIERTVSTTWKDVLLKNPQQLSLIDSSLNGKRICPISNLIFNAFTFFNMADTRVVILGQDPYHTINCKLDIPVAHGLAFSSQVPSYFPPSLRNVVSEIPSWNADSGSDLTRWAQQGVLLLNSSLTVEPKSPNCHASLWQDFTDDIIRSVSQECQNVVFMLWGNFAKSKKGLIDESKHLVLSAGHPSPFSSHLFKGCDHFSIANAYLKTHGKKPVTW
jgi:uracil-DNA glycosylase